MIKMTIIKQVKDFQSNWKTIWILYWIQEAMENFVFHNENRTIDKNERNGEHADGGDGEQVHALKIN